MLDVRNLRVRYGRMLAVSDVSLHVAAGQLVAMVGANGAGKTTTLKAISGLVGVEAGTVTFQGKPTGGLAAHRIARFGVAHVPEGRGLLGALTVRENLKLGAYGGNRARAGGGGWDLERVLTFFPALRARMDDNASVLSGGEQQMLSLARALMTQPKLLMIDEMSLGLAPKLVQQLMEVVVQLVRSGTGVCVEQNTKLVLKNADHAYVLETGKTILDGPGRELLGHERIVRAYLGKAPAA